MFYCLSKNIWSLLFIQGNVKILVKLCHIYIWEDFHGDREDVYVWGILLVVRKCDRI